MNVQLIIHEDSKNIIWSEVEPTSFVQADVELLKATICGPKTSKAGGTCVFITLL